ncbi:MAG: Ni/Fe hydrogenase subunit alpha [Planctomycetes bacterium]|nr:Ni/Fe hydrogenase subunit alpha [Planctomycetota bacterium]
MSPSEEPSAAKEHKEPKAPVERTYVVDYLTRVEGEGAFYLRVRGRKVEEARLAIFEPPRFFEALLRGRSFAEVPDIVARICGICPVAYQMSSVRAIENAFAMAPAAEVRRLRRLLYCGEWIESHALHVYLLHAPDFLGYESAVEMARDHREAVERGLRMKRTGNELLAVLGGRAIHPVSVRVGGFTKAPALSALWALRADLARGLEEAVETVRWAARLPMPDFRQEYLCVSLSGDEYPLEWGDAIRIGDDAEIPVEDFEKRFKERQRPYSNALQCLLDGRKPYLVGPAARLNHHASKLHPRAAALLGESGLSLPVSNPFESIRVRALELVHAFAEAIDLVDAYRPPERPYAEPAPREATGCGATEAPRGLLFHRYEIGADGLVKEAKIVPPTSQNQARIEADLRKIALDLTALPHDAATRRCEHLIRNYDPCISCATHFLRLEIDRRPDEGDEGGDDGRGGGAGGVAPGEGRP